MSRTLIGLVTSDKSNKTIVVTVTTRKTHSLYKKQYSVSSKFMAHDESNQAKVGDKVLISEVRPLSKRKRFNLTEIIEKARVRHQEPEVEVVKKEDEAKS